MACSGKGFLVFMSSDWVEPDKQQLPPCDGVGKLQVCSIRTSWRPKPKL